jgi:hypothetical protein
MVSICQEVRQVIRCIVDLVGKHGRVRTVSMPTWCKVAIDAWAAAAGIADGAVFRPVNRGAAIRDTALSEKVVWQLIRPYAEAAGVAGIAPHDCRGTWAKLCRAAGGELEQIQMLLGYSAVQPGGSLYGLQASNPVDADIAYHGSSNNYGQRNDPVVGRRVGGVNVFGCGLVPFERRRRKSRRPRRKRRYILHRPHGRLAGPPFSQP